MLTGAALLAQDPTVPPLRLPARPVTTPVVPTVAHATGGELNPDDIVHGLEFPDANVRDVLRFYEGITGKHLIYDAQAIGQISIDVKGDLKRSEAKKIIEITLLMNGFTLVEGEGNLVKVLGISRNPRGFGIPIIFDEMQIPEGEQVITYVFRLQYADPQEVANTLQNYIVQAPSNYSQMVPLPKAQAIVLTENSLIIRKILQFVKEVDVPPAEVVSEFIPLERADAKDVLEKLEKIFEKNPQPGATGANGQPATAAAPARPVPVSPEGNVLPNATATPAGPNAVELSNGGLTEDSIIVGKIRLIADTRTNRIHVITRPQNMPFVRKLVQEFDADVPFGEPTSRPLRFVFAGDVLASVVDAITEPGQKQEGGQGGGSSGSSKSSNRSNNSNFNNSSSLGGTSGSLGGSNTSLNGSSTSGNGGSALSESLNTEERDTVPETKIIGSTKIIADKRSNTIIVLGNKEVKDKIFSLLDKLDVRPAQVMLHTIIGELTLDNTKQLGVNYVVNNGNSHNLGSAATSTTTTGTTGTTGTGTTGTGSDSTGTGSAAAGQLLSVASSGNPVLNLANLLGNTKVSQVLTAGSGGFSGFIAGGNSFAALVTALESTDNFRVISRPSVFTTNNKKALISSGEEIAVPENITSGFNGSTTTTDGLVTQSSISYKEVAVQLEVLPLINSDREVTLDIVQKVNQQDGSDTIDNNQIPRIASRTLQTTVSVPNQGTVCLGGLIKDSVDKSKAGIPGLMHLPLIGALFRTKTTTRMRTELVILIRPEVTVGPAEDVKVREREMEYLNLEPDLESTVYPPNARKRVPSAQFDRHRAVELRTDISRDLLPGK